VALEKGADEQGNSESGTDTVLNCRDTLIRSESDGVELVGIGLDDLIVIAMRDAVLAANRSRAQDVKKAVEALKAKRDSVKSP
jgi:mannose-1-phosphate guanylyltransferase/mannose-6-phosphate isomerase